MSRTPRLRRGIYLLPTSFTVANMFCGYWSLVLASTGATERAAVLIIVAIFLDGLDGRIARLTRTSSAFGVQFDSMADIVSFGVAPALLAYYWVLRPLGRLGWLIGFLFVVCGAMRLARFNIRTDTAERRHFSGLPSPMAAAVLACVVFAFPDAPLEGWFPTVAAVSISALGLLMISRFRYRSFKEIDLGHQHSYTYVLPLAAIIVAVAMRPKWTLLVIAAAYLLSSPFAALWNLVRRASGHAAPIESEVGNEPAIR
ncbi:MAG: CDP-diacylglycerol--serine O-phosphatidyltransferase [bacterium]|nr:CDP-diacylglycerol--serine O-phosphatidyltransferase [bacterium]